MEEEPAVLYKWHVESESDAMQRAIQLKEWVDNEYVQGRNPFAVQTRPNHTPWSEVLKRFESPLSADKCMSSQKCSTMGTYVNDVNLDAHSRYRKQIWAIIRMVFAAKDPTIMQQYLGYKSSPPQRMTLPDGRSGIVVFLSQSDYSQHIVEDYEGVTGKFARKVDTPCQQNLAPRPEDLEPLECGTGRRKIIGEIIYSSRCTRPDESFGVGHLGQYVEKWCHLSEAQLAHLVGYIANSVEYKLVFLNSGDS